MATNIDQLIGLLGSKNGTARPNVFQVNLPSLPGATASELNILCREVSLPGRQMATYDKVVGTKNEKVAYGSVTDDVAMSFLALNDYGVKKYFEGWQKLAYDQDAFQMGYKSTYAKQVTIHQMKKGFSFPIYNKALNLPHIPTSIKNRLPSLGPINFAESEIDIDFATPDAIVYTCTLHQAWPISIDSIMLNNELDGLVEVRVQLAYTKWTSETPNQQSNSQYLTDLAIGSVITNVFK
jgi:hypothetical protein